MKKFGKTIKLFLIDGEPNGRMTCELSNWTGKAYRIPRILVRESSDRDELKNPGVYLLFGKNEEGKEIVYIGEAEIIFDRLKQHLSQKDFWNEVITFISKDENLNKAHIKYLENRLFEKAQQTKRYIIYNNTIPTKSSISESDRAEMEEFIENIKLLTNTLGHKVFEEIRETKTIKQEKQRTFEIKATRGANAKGIPTSSGFVVFKDSEIATSIV
ncbi:MAG: GIY-YIG nuclease family protein, partial [Bacteroidales bacterium]|nr:GIY-YIG nuclease family protein [Bacteroidales bacterium]